MSTTCEKTKFTALRQEELYRRTRAGSCLGNLSHRAVYHVGSWLSVSCKLHVVWCCTYYLGKECPGVRKWIWHTHAHTHRCTATFPRPPHLLSQVHLKFVFSFRWTMGDRRCCNLQSDSVSVISIKAKRTTAHCNSQQTESTTAVNSSSFSEATGRRGESRDREREDNKEQEGQDVRHKRERCH